MGYLIARDDIFNPVTPLAEKGYKWSNLKVDNENRLLATVAVKNSEPAPLLLDSSGRLLVSIAIQDGEGASLKVDSANRLIVAAAEKGTTPATLKLDDSDRLLAVVAEKYGVPTTIKLDTYNRVQVTPTRFGQLHFMASKTYIHIAESYPSHDWTIRTSYTLLPNRIALIQNIHLRTDLPAAGYNAKIQITIDDKEICFLHNTSDVPLRHLSLDYFCDYIMIPNTVLKVLTYSDNPTDLFFLISISMLIYLSSD